MVLDRRSFIKKLMGCGLVAFLPLSVVDLSESTEDRIHRLFKGYSKNKTNPALATIAKMAGQPSLSLREGDDLLRSVSDEDFINILEKNIRQDFKEDRIITLARWQLAQTEVAIMGIMATLIK